MKSMDYIQWESLKNIPFSECIIKEDDKNQDIDFYYKGKLIMHDYNHRGYYMYDAVQLFFLVEDQKSQWLNLENLWTLRCCIRENINHFLGVDKLIYGQNFDDEHFRTATPLTEKRFKHLCEVIKELDPYASI